MTPRRLTQAERILRYIRANPGCTTRDLSQLDPFIANVRGRISDLRAEGYRIDCRPRDDGYDGYWLDDRSQLRLAL